MKSNYKTVQPWVLAYEGGWVNDPRDPGGATMEGVTQRTYDADRRRRGLGVRSVRQFRPRSGGVWFASQLFTQVNMLTTAAELRDTRIARVEATSAAQAVSFATLSAQLVGLRDSIVEMKDVQKETNSLLRQTGGRP